VRKVSAVYTNFYMRRNPRVRSSITIILVATASLLIQARAAQCSSCPVPTFRKRWPGDWTKEWFYVKNNLKAREDIKEVIMRPSGPASAFGNRR
jgi:hypothetical protein